MSLNATPRGNRVHIALFGRRNAGKSSVINAITDQEIAIVSDVKGTTTDPVYKSMEILPIGPTVIIDTAGLDDFGELGELRKKKTIEVLSKTDVALVVIDASQGVTEDDQFILDLIREKNIPQIIVLNKQDEAQSTEEDIEALKEKYKVPVLPVSAANGKGIQSLKKAIASSLPEDEDKFRIIGDLIQPGDLVVLVTPIDKAAPKGRLILPQQQTIRDILESDAIAVVTKEHELKETLENSAQSQNLL